MFVADVSACVSFCSLFPFLSVSSNFPTVFRLKGHRIHSPGGNKPKVCPFAEESSDTRKLLGTSRQQHNSLSAVPSDQMKLNAISPPAINYLHGGHTSRLYLFTLRASSPPRFGPKRIYLSTKFPFRSRNLNDASFPIVPHQMKEMCRNGPLVPAIL